MNATRTLRNKILPCYKHLFEPNDIQIEFLYGTRDSGKTKAGSQLALYDYTKTGKDFKCILIRKVKDTIKDSIYSNVLDIVSEWKLDMYFDTSKSPMEIRSTIDNGMFICRGLDEPAKLKSLMNPTMAIIEEGDQITSDDLTMILTTLRHNTIKTKLVFMFNPEMPKGVNKKEDWWLWKDWFSHTNEKSFTHTKMIDYVDNGVTKQLSIKYRATHTTFEDNPYCPPERKAHYHNLKYTNPTKYLPYAKGEWGIREVKSPAFWNFKPDKHVGKTEPVPNVPLLFWVDFNNDLACTVWQIYRDEKGHKIRGLREVKIKPQQHIHSTQLLIDWIKLNYPNHLHSLCMTTDATGGQKTAAALSNLFQLNKAFNLGRRLQTPTVNPHQKDSLELVNYVLYHHNDLLLDPSMENLIFDLQNVEKDADGKLVKDNRKDITQQADFSDTLRYGFNFHFFLNDNIYKYPAKFGIK
jgi:PBSX family phage terminase large subunit